MLCPARCSCFLCRELQSCRAADARKPTNSMCDNFILKKAEAWESSGALKFIRGAARLSVRHWQSRDPAPPVKRPVTHKSTSCEQLYPHPGDEEATGMRRAPSTERVRENKSVFKLLGNSRSKKTNHGEAAEPKNKRGMLNFMRNDVSNTRNVHEKYVPLPQSPASGSDHIYSEPRVWSGQTDACWRPPVYQSVDKTKFTDSRVSLNDNKIYSSRPPCYDELAQRLAQDRNRKSTSPEIDRGLTNKITQTNNNKVVIYFGDSIVRKNSDHKKEDFGVHVEEAIYANRLLDETSNLGLSREVDKGGGNKLISEVEVQEGIYSEIKSDNSAETAEVQPINDATYKKDTFGTYSSDGFIVMEIEGNYERARQLVELVHNGPISSDHHEATVLDDEDLFDWSFIQDWRKRASSGSRAGEPAGWTAAPALSAARATRVRLPQPAQTQLVREPPPHTHAGDNFRNHNHSPPVDEPPSSGVQLKSVTAPSQLTVQSTPVRAAPAQTTYGLERRPQQQEHCHRASDNVPPSQNVPAECGSSSDENRSSGHASMSDSGGAGEEPRRPRPAPHHARIKHRPHNKVQSPWPGGGGLEDIRSAIKQLTLRSSSSTATSGASSGGHSVGECEAVTATKRLSSESEAPLMYCVRDAGGCAADVRRRRAPSLDTVCTNVTSADEFVWVDSHNRLVELSVVPWSTGQVSRVLATGRCRDMRVASDAPARLAYLLQRALVRVGREAQRLSSNLGFCSKHEIIGAFRIILSTSLADACIKGGQRAATMFATSAARRVGTAARARTCLAPGAFLRWMVDVRIANFVHEYAAIYLCAGMEVLMEEVGLLAGADGSTISPSSIELAATTHLQGLLHPAAHLHAGRDRSVDVGRWESSSSLSSGVEPRGLSHDSGITTNGSGESSVSAESVLQSTCAGSLGELRAVLRRALSARHAPHTPLTPQAERTLYYFMRCSQLEHGTAAAGTSLWSNRGGALPPLGLWLRVSLAHASLRPAPSRVDDDDVRQAARLLLPHADCVCRPLTLDDPLWSRWSDPGSKPRGAALDTPDAGGLTLLMKAAALGDEHMVSSLLEAGADPNVETPGAGGSRASSQSYIPPTAGWTALVYACAVSGGAECARRLLAGGACPDGAPAAADVCTLTPLQVACGAGNVELVQLLLSHGADPFLSTQLTDALCYSPAAQYGCYSPVAVCCTHGRRAALRVLLGAGGGAGGGAGSGAGGGREVLSLEEVLAEGAAGGGGRAYSKAQQRALQDAMYYAAETDHLDITLELRSLGVSWSLQSWTLSLAAAADAHADNVIDQLLQDFLQVCPSDDSHYSHQFIYETLPLLFNILRYSKKEGTVLLLADILCCVYGWEPIPAVSAPAPAPPPAAPRIDPSYVNNPALSDVTFRVEGRLFYGHKIVLVSESPRLRAMLAPTTTDTPPGPAPDTPPSAPPLVQINDIRYHIFEQVMRYLYGGGAASLAACDVLELLAAASHFRLLPLQRQCEARAASTLALHNLLSYYIHAHVYGATELLEYCQGFLLQNMVALLTYDDAVKKLLFGKRLPGHNVLAALLATLQKRVEARKTQAKTR